MKSAVLSGAKWVFVETLLKNALTLALMVILARLLTPADFGLIAMLAVFVGVATALSEGGLGAALIQERVVTDEDISSVFWLQLLMAITVSLLFILLGPWLAEFMGYAELAGLAAGYAAVTFLTALGNVQQSLYVKAFNFRAVTLSALTGQTVGGCVAVVLALNGGGPWAIAAQAIATAAVTSSLLWMQSAWRPNCAISSASLHRLISVGAQVMGISVLAEMENRTPAFLLGAASGSTTAGLYQRGSSFQLLLVRLVSGVVTKVSFPAFAELQDDPERLLLALRQANQVNFTVTAFAMWTVALCANEIVNLFFGAQWTATIPVLQALCLAAGFYPIYAVGTKALRAIGKTKLVFWQQMMRLTGISLAVVFSFDFGFVVTANAVALVSVLMVGITVTAMQRHLRYKYRLLLTDSLPGLVAGIGMILLVLYDRPLISESSYLLALIVKSGAATLVYCFCAFATVLIIPHQEKSILAEFFLSLRR